VRIEAKLDKVREEQLNDEDAPDCGASFKIVNEIRMSSVFP
jgi:hypothetical protein